MTSESTFDECWQTHNGVRGITVDINSKLQSKRQATRFELAIWHRLFTKDQWLVSIEPVHEDSEK